MSNLAEPMHRQEGRWPTPTEWVERFHAASPEQQEQTAEKVIESAQQAFECFRMNHRELQQTLQSVTPVAFAASVIAQAWLDDVRPSGQEEALAAAFPHLASAIESLLRETHPQAAG